MLEAFHVGSNDTTTPHELISEVIEKTRGISNAVTPVMLNDFLDRKNLPEYRYPRHGGLSVEKSQEMLNVRFNWLERYCGGTG
jgi:hypothetical protein